MQKTKYINAIALDIGEKRIGVARVNSVAQIPEPLATLQNDGLLIESLNKIISEESVDLVVVGLPRNMSGEETKQTEAIKNFVESNLRSNIDLPIIFQDETLSSVRAAEYPKDLIEKKGIDAVAAAEILQYFIRDNQ